jgi:hypothetical protein
MPESKSVIYNPQNPQSEEESNYQIAQIGSFKIAFRTMPQDLKFLLAKQKQADLPDLEKIKAKGINISEKTETEKPEDIRQEDFFPDAMKNGQEPVLAAGQGMKDETKNKFEKTPQKKELTPKLPILYKEARALYKRALYDEAIEKFIDILDASPNHWRAKWYLGRAKKKLSTVKKGFARTQQSDDDRKKELTEQLKKEQEKQKQIIIKLETEARAKKEAEAKARIEAESREKVSHELELMEQEKIAAIAQTQQAQVNLEKIKQEAEEKARQEFIQKFKLEEEQIKKEQEARHQLEAELVASEQEKEKMEKEIIREREALLQSQQTVTEQLASMGQQPPMPGETLPPSQASGQYAPLAEPAPIPLEPIYTAPAYVPSPLLPISETKEMKVSFFARFTELIHPFLASKTARIIGASVFLGIAAIAFIYFTGLYKIFLSSSQPAQPEIKQEEVLPSALFTINQTETIILKAGQKKNLFQEINKIAEKSQTPGSFTRILVKFISEDQQQKYASLVDLIDSLQIVFSSELLSNLDGNYTLFLYSQKEILDSPFLASLGENKLGLVMGFRESSEISRQFASWQPTMPIDLDALFLGKKISFGQNYQFQELTYKGILIHSLDLPNQYSSLNYALTGNKALIATSLESSQSLIDRIATAK